jgi:23S rRNA (adenine-N6)-dimethyltransferase
VGQAHSRRRALGQNFLADSRVAEALAATVGPGELVVDLGAGAGALTLPLARAGARVLAVEADPLWAHRLRQRARGAGLTQRIRVVAGDLRTVALPDQEAYRVVANPPFGQTTALLRRLLDEPATGPVRADLLLQEEVARKRAAAPPTTLLSTTWAPYWEFALVRRVPRTAFRPQPAVDAAWLTITRRDPALLPPAFAGDFAAFVRDRWQPLTARGGGRGRWR